ncbi:hypothetical protein SELMODRAFT_420728 [Selaginella moellendorffii]|uniref:Ribosomal RNA-processing protein 7 C-terminal domain-containing protein n=1 Tax=Selaginella moellendorffii TaxID=88036 RepID=D8SCX5_SELML|nr:hypothetical protein SELMODRAFT_420728 [Selaginella moellendorffii]
MKKIAGKSEKNASRSEVNLVKEKKIKKKVLEGGKLLAEKKKISSEKKKRSLDLVPVPERTSENEDGDRLKKKKKISEKKLGKKKEIVEEDDSDLEITLKKKKKKLVEEIEDGENEQKVEKTLKKKKKFVEETEDGQNEQKVVKTLKKKKKTLVEETEDGENEHEEKTLKKKKVVEEIEDGQHEEKVEKALNKQKKKLVEDGNQQKLEKKLKKKKKEVEPVVPASSGGAGSGDGEAGKTLQGMEKWIAEYNARRPGIHVLQEQLDSFIADYEEREEQARKERQVAASGDGWTVVTRQKGKRRSADATSGIAVGAVHAAVAANAEKKTQGLDDFYKFQKRDSHRNGNETTDMLPFLTLACDSSEVAQLQLKFQEDKKKIAQMRAARKFRPY